jgi:CRISPR system Cascade subunit CasA
MLNLVTDAWLPARTRGGSIRVIRPAEIAAPDLLGLDLPRADFDGAVTEFLIGLLATTYAPANEREWQIRWDTRPKASDLDTAFAPIASAFDLGSFMQADLDCEPEPVDRLLIDAAGERGTDQSLDLLNRRGVTALSPAMAAAALLTLQWHATTAGVGYRTSIRGGGPMTTTIVAGDDLWGRLWPNIETSEQAAARSPSGKVDLTPAAIFPWVRPASDAAITPDNASALAVYWTMPRRVRLIASPTGNGACDLTGEQPAVLIREVRRTNYGPEFAGWTHPLTAYYQSKAEWLPVRARPSPIGYRDWLGLIQNSVKGDRRPAQAVTTARLHRSMLRHVRLATHGWAVTQAQAHRWVSGEMPVMLADADTRAERERLARLIVTSAEAIAKSLGKAVNAAGGTIGAADRFWRETEAAFLAAIVADLDMAEDDPSLTIRQTWLIEAQRAAYAAFQAHTEDVAVRDVVAAEHRLNEAMKVKALAKVLELPVPKPAKTTRPHKRDSTTSPKGARA